MRTPILLLALATAAVFPACRGMRAPQRLASERSQARGAAYLAQPLRVGQLVVHADFMLSADHRLLQELASERETILQRLRLPGSDKPIHVHLFADEMSYRQHVSREYPNFADRRALFAEDEAGLAVYAHWNDEIAEDLRHEVAHGYLHASVPNLPLWLDEGLAEYFEVSRGQGGRNQMHVDYLRGQLTLGGWQPSLERLEELTVSGEMTQLQYAEAWLWVHWLLESPHSDSRILTDHLAELRAEAGLTTTLATRLRMAAPGADLLLVDHLKAISH